MDLFLILAEGILFGLTAGISLACCTETGHHSSEAHFLLLFSGLPLLAAMEAVQGELVGMALMPLEEPFSSASLFCVSLGYL